VTPPIPSTPQDGYEKYVIGWGKEAIEEGDAFLKAQEGYSKIEPSINAIMSKDEDFRASWLSGTRANQVAKIAGDLAALMTDIKPFWEFRTQNNRYEKQAIDFGKLSIHWFLQRQIDVRFTEVVKYWEVSGTGYANQYYDSEIEDLDMSAEDPRDVLPVRPASYLTLEGSLGVILRRERTVNYLRSRYPSKAHLIEADRDGSSASAGFAQTRVGKLMESLASPFAAYMARVGIARRTPRIPTADCYTLYVADDRRNEKSERHPVGEFDAEGKPLNNWSYWVEPGDLLYPRKRCIVFTNTAVLYDGPSIYWHGKFPLTKYTLDPWPWSWLGKAPIHDLLPLQKSLDRMLRIVDDHMEKVARPDLIADKNSISKASLERIDTRKAGLKLSQNPLMGKGIQLVYPNPLPPEVFKQIEFLIDQMEKLSGTRDMSQLMKLNQIPSSDTIDRMMEAMTPLVRLRSRMFEAFMREFATKLAYNFAQFYTLPMRMRILGADGITPEDFDYDPGTLIPDYVHDADFDHRGVITPEAFARGPLPRYERAREFLRQFNFYVMPGSMLSASEIEKKLMYLQFYRAGLIDRWSLLEQWNVPNVGNPPDGANTITERLVAEQQLGLGGTASAAGRKSSGQELPRIKISESG